jgi:alanyl-tRNA synthetase
MTQKLYYEDAYQADFKAKVLSIEPHSIGYEIVLDRTCFYPEGGGQKSDEGELNGQSVLDVFEKAEKVCHVVNQALKIGQEVEGRVDFSKRLDAMRQHTAEHILSGIISKEYGYDNVGFHLSDTYTTADFNGTFTEQQVKVLERKANQAVLANLPIKSGTYTKESLKEKTYRSKIEVEEVRLVEVPGYDTCACCGLHVAFTGEVGLIKIVQAKKYKGGTRFTLLAGERALMDYQAKQAVTHTLSTLLSAKEEKILEAYNVQQENYKELKGKYLDILKKLFEVNIKNMLQEQANQRLVFHIEENLSSEEMKIWANICRMQTNQTFLLVVPNEQGYRTILGGEIEEVKELGALMNKVLGGKGGGKEMYQGTLLTTKDQLERFAKEQNL